MTAEIAIINRSAIALAADSAVTVGEERVWKSTNKLFSLSPMNDIGIMIYGSGDFCGVPWDIIIKSYRCRTSKHFETVENLYKDFINFLLDFSVPHDELESLNIYRLFLNVINECFEGTDNMQPMQFRSKLKGNIRDLQDILDKFDLIDQAISTADFNQEFAEIIKALAKEKTPHKITKEIYSSIIRICSISFNKALESGYETGVVFCGYGSTQIFPELIHVACDGRSSLGLRYWTRGRQNLNDKDAPSAAIFPFAQKDIFYLFVEGIDSSYLEFLHRVLSGVLYKRTSDVIDRYVKEDEQLVEKRIQEKENDAAVEAFGLEFREFRKSQTVSPMMTVIRSLPKDEMAAMAEALVEITSLRRKIDSKLESVGGPVDVAVISKGDGFVWIKRKHYFSSDLNSDYPVRRRMRHQWDGEKNDG